MLERKSDAEVVAFRNFKPLLTYRDMWDDYFSMFGPAAQVRSHPDNHLGPLKATKFRGQFSLVVTGFCRSLLTN